MRADTRDYYGLLCNDTALLDVRAPVEFKKGAFPQATNLPLLNDAERERVGTCFVRQGQQAAIALGHQLVSGPVKEARLQAWVNHIQAHPDGYLYCFRGGLRSQIVQQWLADEAGIRYPRVLGGYKAMRNALIAATEQALGECAFVVLGGLTGTGKTEILCQLDNGLDLEGHAHHRGSSFGRRVQAQPAQIDFENRLAIDILKKRRAGLTRFVLEDESRTIGRCSLPPSMYQGLQHYPMVWLHDSLENRVERILRDYVVDMRAEFSALHGATEQSDLLYAQHLQQGLDNIARRLGGERHARLKRLMTAALQEQARSGAVDLHRDWITSLLNEYYDPMYMYQRQLKSARIVFSGDPQSVLEHLRRHYA